MKHKNVAFFIPHAGCPHQCSFCNQYSITGSCAPTGEEVRRTLSQAAQRLSSQSGTAQIAFFGGSFTAVPLHYQAELLEAAYPFVRAGLFSGIRISTRPDAVNEEILNRLRDYGVDAVELGAQSMDDRVLERNRRGHTARDVKNASRLVKVHGLELGLQMMTGLYGEAPGGAYRTAETLCELQPDTVRIYPAVVLEGTELARLYREGRYQPQALLEASRLCAGLLELFESHGIRVIRLGLHDEPAMRETYVAGPYHPAFRELCESVRYRELMEQALFGKPHGSYFVGVHPGEISKAVGQKRENIRYFEQRGYRLRVRGDASQNKYEVKAEDDT